MDEDRQAWRRYLYQAAVDEYRFQTMLNWNRVQYLLAFNAALLAAGAALSRSGQAAALVFVTGVAGCLLSVWLVAVQTGYYRAARNHMDSVAELEDVAAFRLDTTPGMRGNTGFRWPRARNAIYGLFLVLAVADMAGAVLILTTEPAPVPVP